MSKTLFLWGNRIPYFGVSEFPPEIPYFLFVLFFFLARPFLYVKVPERIFPGEVGFYGSTPDRQAGTGWGVSIGTPKMRGAFQS